MKAFVWSNEAKGANYDIVDELGRKIEAVQTREAQRA